MASNKKAQILAAVMCASSILGSYTMVSAENATVTLDNNVFTIKNSAESTTATIGAGVNITHDDVGGGRTIIGGSRIFDDGRLWAGNNRFRVTADGSLGIRNSEGVNSFSIHSDTGSITSKGSISADSLISSKQDIALLDADDNVKYKMSTIGDNTAGIVRDGEKTVIEKNTAVTSTGIVVSKIEDTSVVQDPPTTTTTVKAGYIEIKNKEKQKTFSVDHSGAIYAANGEFTVDAKGNTTTKTVNGVTIETYKDAVRSSGDLKGGDILIGTPSDLTDADKINLSAIDRNTAGISRDEASETTTIEGNTSISKTDGIQTNGLKVLDGDSYLEVDGAYTNINTKGNGLYTNNESATLRAGSENSIKVSKNGTEVIGGLTADKFSTDEISANKISAKGIEITNNLTDTIENRFSVSNYGINMTSTNGGVRHGASIGPDGVSIFSGDTSVDYKTDGVTFSNNTDGSTTTINGGSINASGTIVGSDVQTENYSLNKIGNNTQAITYGSGTTTINGKLNTFGDVTSNNGQYSLNTIGANTQAISYSNGTTKFTGDVESDKYSLNTIGSKFDGLYDEETGDITTLKQKTQAMSYSNGTTNFDGNINASDDVTSSNGKYSLNNIGTNTALITSDGFATTNVNGELAVSNNIITKGDVYTTNAAGTMKYSLNQIGAKTSGIERFAATNTTAIEGNKLSESGIESVGDVTSALDGKTYSLNTIGANTAGITRDKYGTTTIENTVKVHAPGVSHNVGTIDIYGDMIQATDPTGQRTVIEGNGITTNTVTTDTIKIGDKTIDDDFFGNIGDINTNIAGIERNGETTTIEGVASFNKDGVTVATGNSFVSVDTNNIRLNNSGNGIVIDKDGTSIIGGHGSQSINVTRTGTEFLNGQDGTSTVISGGAITTDSITVAGNTIDNEFFENMGANNANTAGIQRDGNDNVGYTTSIETTFRVHTPTSASGTIDVFGDMIQANSTNGQKTIITGNGITTNSLTVGGVSFGELVNRVEDLEEKTQNITPSNPGTGEGGSVVPPTTDGQTGIDGDVTVGGDLSVGGNLTADSATIGGVTMKDNTVTATTGNFDNIAVGGENGTTINKDGITVGKAEEGQSYTSITKDDVKVTDSQGNTTSLTDVGNRVTGLESSMNNMNNRLNDVEDRIDKVGAMAAAIANLRTMGFDPEAPTEIAIGVGQYKSETGLALGVFHYPNQDFMLSASISTSGDEVMGGIGATWKLGRKSAGEKALDAKDEEAKHLEKAEEMKKLAQDAKVKAQAERHAKLLAEREAQKTA